MVFVPLLWPGIPWASPSSLFPYKCVQLALVAEMLVRCLYSNSLPFSLSWPFCKARSWVICKWQAWRRTPWMSVLWCQCRTALLPAWCLMPLIRYCTHVVSRHPQPGRCNLVLLQGAYVSPVGGTYCWHFAIGLMIQQFVWMTQQPALTMKQFSPLHNNQPPSGCWEPLEAGLPVIDACRPSFEVVWFGECQGEFDGWFVVLLPTLLLLLLLHFFWRVLSLSLMSLRFQCLLRWCLWLHWWVSALLLWPVFLVKLVGLLCIGVWRTQCC